MSVEKSKLAVSVRAELGDVLLSVCEIAAMAGRLGDEELWVKVDKAYKAAELAWQHVGARLEVRD